MALEVIGTIDLNDNCTLIDLENFEVNPFSEFVYYFGSCDIDALKSLRCSQPAFNGLRIVKHHNAYYLGRFSK